MQIRILDLTLNANHLRRHIIEMHQVVTYLLIRSQFGDGKLKPDLLGFPCFYHFLLLHLASWSAVLILLYFLYSVSALHFWIVFYRKVSTFGSVFEKFMGYFFVKWQDFHAWVGRCYLHFQLYAFNHFNSIDHLGCGVIQNGFLGQIIKVEVGKDVNWISRCRLVADHEIENFSRAYFPLLLAYWEISLIFVMPQIVHRDNCVVMDFKIGGWFFARLAVIEIKVVMEFFNLHFLIVNFIQANLRGVRSSNQFNRNSLLLALIWNECNFLFKFTLLVWGEVYVHWVFLALLYFQLSRPNSKHAHNSLFVISGVLDFVGRLPAWVGDKNLFELLVTDPAMTTIDLTWPLSLALLTLGFDGNPYNSVADDDDELIFVVVKIYGFESNENRYLHSWGNIPRVLYGILDVGDHELLFLQWGYLDSLNMLGPVYKLDFAFINFIGFEVREVQLHRVDSEYTPTISILEGFNVLHSFGEVPGILSECDFPVHALDDFIIIYLLLNGKLG